MKTIARNLAVVFAFIVAFFANVANAQTFTVTARRGSDSLSGLVFEKVSQDQQIMDQIAKTGQNLGQAIANSGLDVNDTTREGDETVLSFGTVQMKVGERFAFKIEKRMRGTKVLRVPPKSIAGIQGRIKPFPVAKVEDKKPQPQPQSAVVIKVTPPVTALAKPPTSTPTTTITPAPATDSKPVVTNNTIGTVVESTPPSGITSVVTPTTAVPTKVPATTQPSPNNFSAVWDQQPGTPNTIKLDPEVERLALDTLTRIEEQRKQELLKERAKSKSPEKGVVGVPVAGSEAPK